MLADRAIDYIEYVQMHLTMYTVLLKSLATITIPLIFIIGILKT